MANYTGISAFRVSKDGPKATDITIHNPTAFVSKQSQENSDAKFNFPCHKSSQSGHWHKEFPLNAASDDNMKATSKAELAEKPSEEKNKNRNNMRDYFENLAEEKTQ